MTKPSKQQIAAVRSALREIHAELLGWDPHILVLFKDEMQKAQIIARMNQLGWHYVSDPTNETDDVSMVEFSLDKPSASITASAARRGQSRRVRFPASFFASFAVISTLAGVAVAVSAFYTDYRMGLLDKAGTRTTGEVERTYSMSNRGNRTYYVSYRFVDTHGFSHESEDPYPFGDWNGLHQGDPISITYLADDPQRNNLTRRVRLITDRSLRDEITWIGIPWVIAGCFFLGYLVRRRRS